MPADEPIEYPRLNPSERTLLGPDLSNASPRARQGLIASLQGAADPEFLRVATLGRSLLRRLWRTDNDATFIVPGSEETGMEAVLVNLIEHGEPVLVCTAGFFGERLAQAAAQLGGDVHVVEAPWGEPIDPESVRAGLRSSGAKLVACVHGELSTGVLHPLAAIAAAAHDAGALIAADLCATTAVLDVPVDDWRVDAVWSGSQKGLSGFPGLALLSLSERAVARIESRTEPVRSWVLDLEGLRDVGSPERRQQTVPAPILFALTEMLELAYEQGMAYREGRHWNRHAAVARALETLGLTILGRPGHLLPSVLVVRVPAGVDRLRLLDDLRTPFRIEVGPGLGDWAATTFRIGILSHSAQPGFLVQLVAVLERLLEAQGHAAPSPGLAVRALVDTLDP